MANNGRFEAMAMLLATGSSVKAASQKIGVSCRQAYRISSSDRMKKRVAVLRSEITSEAIGQMTAAATQAAVTLKQLLAEENEPSIRMNAAKAILNVLGPLSELGELRARLDNLERSSALRVV
jgi:hypothetical protein